MLLKKIKEWLNKKHKKIAQTTTEKLNKSHQTINKLIIIRSQNNKETIETSYENLFFVRSDGNYCTVFMKNNEKLQKKIIRVTLKKLQNELSEKKKIVRCHKSYIVNLNKVKKVTGNARGYNFFIDDVDFSIPVSRNFSKELFAFIEN